MGLLPGYEAPGDFTEDVGQKVPFVVPNVGCQVASGSFPGGSVSSPH